GVGRSRRVWASMVSGAPGLITATSSRTLRLAAGLPDADPLSEGLSRGGPLGVLVIDPERRRRLRSNGRVVRADRDAIEIRSEEVFGNCPKYIQARALEPDAEQGRVGDARRSQARTEPQRLRIERGGALCLSRVHPAARR